MDGMCCHVRRRVETEISPEAETSNLLGPSAMRSRLIRAILTLNARSSFDYRLAIMSPAPWVWALTYSVPYIIAYLAQYENTRSTRIVLFALGLPTVAHFISTINVANEPRALLVAVFQPLSPHP